MPRKRSNRVIEDRGELRTQIARVRRNLDRRCREELDPLAFCARSHQSARQHPLRSLLVVSGLSLLAGLLNRKGAAVKSNERLLERAVGSVWSRIGEELQSLIDRITGRKQQSANDTNAAGKAHDG